MEPVKRCMVYLGILIFCAAFWIVVLRIGIALCEK